MNSNIKTTLHISYYIDKYKNLDLYQFAVETQKDCRYLRDCTGRGSKDDRAMARITVDWVGACIFYVSNGGRLEPAGAGLGDMKSIKEVLAAVQLNTKELK